MGSMNTLPIHIQQPGQLATPLETVDDAVRHFLRQQHADNSRRAYLSDCRNFAAWCAAASLEALPSSPETIARYFSAQAIEGIAPKSLVRRRAAIRWMHETAGHNSPTTHPLVRQTMRGIMREVGNGARDQKQPIVADQLADMLRRVDVSKLAGLRDRALLLVGFSGAFRRSELSTIKVEHLRYQSAGVAIFLPRSKTDQDGNGRTVPIFNGARFRPVDALREYIEAAGIVDGYVFRGRTNNGKVRTAAISHQAIADIIKRYAALAGLDPAEVSGHSLRAGFVTTGVMHDANLFKLMEVTGHKEVKTLKGYARIAEQFKNHAGASFL